MNLTILLLIAIAGALYGLIYYFVSRLMFRPTRYPEAWWPTQEELGARDVWLTTSDGLRLHAWWIEAAGSELATLYLKGNGTNLSNRPGHLREIVAAGSSVLIVDYRGYGKSPGRPTERGVYRDADAGYEYLVAAGYEPARIVLLGESMGSAIAVDLASRRPCGGIILECPFTSYRAMADKVVPYIGRFFAGGFDSLSKIRRVRAPVLIIHGDRDGTVPQRMGRELFEAANEPTWFWSVEGATHRNIVQTGGDEYGARLREFFERVTRGATLCPRTEKPAR